MSDHEIQILELTTPARASLAFDVVRQLRPHLDSVDAFLSRLEMQRSEGYRLAGAFVGNKLVAVAGFRQSCTMARGPHLFVDDLVTDAGEQGKGYGLAMIDWLRTLAHEAGLARVHLDSRDTAIGFYERAGFTFLTSRPCHIDASSV